MNLYDFQNVEKDLVSKPCTRTWPCACTCISLKNATCVVRVCVYTRLTTGTSTSTSSEIQGLVRVLVFVLSGIRAACTSYKPGTSLYFSLTENFAFY